MTCRTRGAWTDGAQAGTGSGGGGRRRGGHARRVRRRRGRRRRGRDPHGLDRRGHRRARRAAEGAAGRLHEGHGHEDRARRRRRGQAPDPSSRRPRPGTPSRTSSARCRSPRSTSSAPTTCSTPARPARCVKTLARGHVHGGRARPHAADGDQLAVPSDGWSQLLFYRKDLFAAAGLADRRRTTRSQAAAAKLDSGTTAGIVAATAPERLVHAPDVRAARARQRLPAGGRRRATSRSTARSARRRSGSTPT